MSARPVVVPLASAGPERLREVLAVGQRIGKGPPGQLAIDGFFCNLVCGDESSSSDSSDGSSDSGDSSNESSSSDSSDGSSDSGDSSDESSIGSMILSTTVDPEIELAVQVFDNADASTAVPKAVLNARAEHVHNNSVDIGKSSKGVRRNNKKQRRREKKAKDIGTGRYFRRKDWKQLDRMLKNLLNTSELAHEQFTEWNNHIQAHPSLYTSTEKTQINQEVAGMWTEFKAFLDKQNTTSISQSNKKKSITRKKFESDKFKKLSKKAKKQHSPKAAETYFTEIVESLEEWNKFLSKQGTETGMIKSVRKMSVTKIANAGYQTAITLRENFEKTFKDANKYYSKALTIARAKVESYSTKS